MNGLRSRSSRVATAQVRTSLNAPTPLLTIAIPTWNRAPYLALNLQQLRQLLCEVAPGVVELLISDNASTDDTRSVVDAAIGGGTPIRYLRNAENIGSDANIAQCFNEASGIYVLILGDDDLLVDGSVVMLVELLQRQDFGVITLRPYGYDQDFRAEHPGGGGRHRVCDRPADFLARIGPLMTLISGCIVNKRLMDDVDARQFIGGNLVQVHLVLIAALAARQNCFLERYLLACKRNNSGGYDFSSVFVTSLASVLDAHRNAELTPKAIRQIERSFLVGYYPYYLFRQRLARGGDMQGAAKRFEARFGGRMLFDYWVKPIILLPRPFALAWGASATLIGRLLSGDLRRGLMFAANKMLGR